MSMVDLSGKVVFRFFVELKPSRAPRSEGLATHGNTKKVKTKHERRISSIVYGRNHDFPSKILTIPNKQEFSIRDGSETLIPAK